MEAARQRGDVEPTVLPGDELLRHPFDANPNPTALVGPDGRVWMVNRALAELLRCPREALAGRRFDEAMPFDAEALSTYRQALHRTVTARATGRFEGELALVDGQTRYMLASVSPLAGLGGVACGLVVLTDLTERREGERRLERARAEALAASETKSRFLANMSHEIRTPMNGVMGMLGLVLETPLSAEQREYLETAMRSADALLVILNDILDISKIEAKAMHLEHVAVPVRTLVADAVGPLATRAAEKGLAIRVDVDDDVPEVVLGDPVRLRQVLANLVSNAVKFTAQGSVAVRVARAPEEGLLRFTVRDSGIGIPAAQQARVFEAFRQADDSTTRKYGGTGLGLAICGELTALMGGRIGVESEEGKGSTFWFTARLPAASSEAGPAAKPAPALPAAGKPRAIRVLVAEDDRTNALLARRLLERRGCEVALVDTGAAAIERGTSEAFDLVLMDVQMPGMSGLEATARLRAAPPAGARRVPIYALTGSAMPEDAERCRAAGMDGHLAKPLDVALLEAILARVRAASP